MSKSDRTNKMTTNANKRDSKIGANKAKITATKVFDINGDGRIDKNDLVAGMNKLQEQGSAAIKGTSEAATWAVDKATVVSKNAVDAAISAIDENGNNRIDIEDIIYKGFKTPGIKINREEFLRKELKLKYPQEVIDDAVKNTPAHAKIPAKEIDKIADNVIKNERLQVSGISAVLGVPGGAAMAATIPADILQYYGYLLRATQELLYLYGFPQIDTQKDGEQLDSATMNLLILCMGTMYGVAEAKNGLLVVSKMLAQGVKKKLLSMALTKTTVYPIVKEVAQWFAINMTKEVFAQFFEKMIPVAGGVIGSGFTYLSFKPCCERLKKALQDTILSNPEAHKMEGAAL